MIAERVDQHVRGLDVAVDQPRARAPRPAPAPTCATIAAARAGAQRTQRRRSAPSTSRIDSHSVPSKVARAEDGRHVRVIQRGGQPRLRA